MSKTIASYFQLRSLTNADGDPVVPLATFGYWLESDFPFASSKPIRNYKSPIEGVCDTATIAADYLVCVAEWLVISTDFAQTIARYSKHSIRFYPIKVRDIVGRTLSLRHGIVQCSRIVNGGARTDACFVADSKVPRVVLSDRDLVPFRRGCSIVKIASINVVLFSEVLVEQCRRAQFVDCEFRRVQIEKLVT